jgi:FkbM family methyltransferase
MYKAFGLLAARSSSFRSYMYNSLVESGKYDSSYWKKAWKRVILKLVDKPVNTKLHGFHAKVNCGFSYPLVARQNKQFNNPLVQLAYQTYKSKGQPITLIDVGAAVGDTVFLLHSNLDGAFKKILCVDGDTEFYSYLQQNMQQFPFVECVNALLSDTSTTEKELVRIHAGTASAQGENERQSIALDELIIQRSISQVDVLKIDTDGFDGKVLSGAQRILKNLQPNVIFEWHPILLNQTNNDIYQPFEVLANSGYSTFIFYTKFGTFNHFMMDVSREELSSLAEICIQGKVMYDKLFVLTEFPEISSLYRL